MDNMTSVPDYHFSWEDVECGECGAEPGQACTSLYYGNGYVVVDGHLARHETASYHYTETRSVNGQTVTECVDCGHVTDVN